MYEKDTLEVDYHINIVTIIVGLYNNSGTIIVVGLQVIFSFASMLPYILHVSFNVSELNCNQIKGLVLIYLEK